MVKQSHYESLRGMIEDTEMNQHKLLHLEDYDLSLEESMDGIWAQKRLVHETLSEIERSIAGTIDRNAIYDLLIEAEFPTFQQSPIATIEYHNKDRDNTWHKHAYGWHKDHGFTPDGDLKSIGEECLDKIAAGVDEAVKKIVPDHVFCYVAQTLRGEDMQTIRLYRYGEHHGRRLHTPFTLGTQLIDAYSSMVSSTEWNYTAFFPEPMKDGCD